MIPRYPVGCVRGQAYPVTGSWVLRDGLAGPGLCVVSQGTVELAWLADMTRFEGAPAASETRGSLRRTAHGWVATWGATRWSLDDPDRLVDRSEAIAILARSAPGVRFRR